MPQDKTRLTLADAKHLLTAGGLVAGTLGTLLLGAVLRVDPQSVAGQPAAVITAAPAAGGSAATPEPAPQAAAATDPGEVTPPPPATQTPPAASFAERVDDAQRMRARGGDWTLQFMVTCNQALADRLQADLGGDARLYLLPVALDGRPCVRICWDTFRSRDLALAAGFPAALRAINAEPIARAMADVIP